MQRATLSLLLALSVLCCTPVIGADDDDAIMVIEGIAVLDGRLDEAIFYYEHNWGYFRRQALERGYIESFDMVVGDDLAESVDIVLITRFDSAAQYDAIEDRFEEIMSERELKLLNKVEPGDFRKNVFVVTNSASRNTAD
ncbi:MAG: hypothetical protein AAF417_06130 [Pseudomonadota bacterium]